MLLNCLGTLGHVERWVLVSQMKKDLLKGTWNVFWKLLLNILWEIQYLPLFVSRSNLVLFALPQEETFQSMTSTKKYDVTWWHCKNLCLAPLLIIWAGSVWSALNLVLRCLTHAVMKFGGPKLLDNPFMLLGVQEVEEGPKVHFLKNFCDTVLPYLIPLTTKTGTEVEHYNIYINPPVKFCYGLLLWSLLASLSWCSDLSLTPHFKGPWFGPLIDNYDKNK